MLQIILGIIVGIFLGVFLIPIGVVAAAVALVVVMVVPQLKAFQVAAATALPVMGVVALVMYYLL